MLVLLLRTNLNVTFLLADLKALFIKKVKNHVLCNPKGHLRVHQNVFAKC